MGNRQGLQKEQKTKEEKKIEKEAKRDKEKRKKQNDKQKKRKFSGQCGQRLDSDLEASSLVTGADSESSVFHSAENVSSSPYLDSCTRSELEQVPPEGTPYLNSRWGPPSSVSAYQIHNHQYSRYQDPNLRHHPHHLQQEQQHPMVLSSKDFKDGFSLEAFIPSDIARSEVFSYMDETPTGSMSRADTSGHNSSIKSKRSNKSGSVKSKSSKASFKTPGSSHHATPVSLRTQGDDSASMASSHTSTGGGTAGYSTPLLSTPVFGRVERSSVSPLSTASSCLQRVQESDRGDISPNIQTQGNKDNVSCTSPSSLHHHPHFFNHQRSIKQHPHLQHIPNQQLQPQLQIMQQQLQHRQHHQQINPLKTSIAAQNAETKRIFMETFTAQPLEPVRQQDCLQKDLQNQHQLSHLHPFYQNCPDYNNLPKPTSPYPQRRAFSPKMTSAASFKLISSDDSSSSPTTPVPQRRAANFLDFLRPGSKSDKNDKKIRDKNGSGNESEEGSSTPKKENVDSSPNMNKEEKSKLKMRPKWKTWERSKSKKNVDKQSKISMIFGTIRKTDKNTRHSSSGGNTSDGIGRDSESILQTKRTNVEKSSKSSSKGSNSNESSSSKRNSSPPLVKSTAFCIMRLEELERSIENTIREKFPDAEPFLLKKRAKEEEMKASRSLPTTPSLKKKLYVSRDIDVKRHSENHENVASNLNAVSTKLSEVTSRSVNGSKATYESLPSPAMSPVVLRRFGARTRHASISPKIQRAKTAALYSSPREMDRVDEDQASATTTLSKVPMYHSSSSKQQRTQLLSSNFVSPLVNNQKTQSNYDNLNNENNEDVKQKTITTSASSSAHTKQTHYDEDDSDEVDESTYLGYEIGCDTDNDKPVIVPTFSAVFGSVSPKLRRHLEQKMKDASKEKVEQGIGIKSQALMGCEYGSEPKDGSNFSKNTPSNGINSKESLAVQVENGASETTNTNKMTMKESDKKKISVKERIQTLNKSVSEGWGSTPDARNNKVSVHQDLNSSQTKSKIAERRPSGLISPFRVRTSTSESGHTSSAFPASPPSGPFSCPSSPPTTVRPLELVTCRVTGYSPGSQRKHSTEPVVFGSPVALPCRRVSQPLITPSNKETNIQPYISCQSDHVNNPKNIMNGKYQASINIRTNGTALTDSQLKNSEYSGTALSESKLSDITVPKDRSTIKDKTNTCTILETNLDLDTDATAHAERHNQFASEDKDVIFRQPVSKVISDIISGKQPEQPLERLSSDEKPKTNHQSSPTQTTEKCVEEEVTAVMVSSTCIQPLTLEEKTVRNDTLVSLPLSHKYVNHKKDRSVSESDLSNATVSLVSRSAGSQTDSFSTAEKGVESDDLGMFSFSFDKSLSLSPQYEKNSTKYKSFGVGTSSNFDDSSGDDEFIQKVMTFQRTDCPRKEEIVVKEIKHQIDAEFMPPPPSPSAMKKLLEEEEEEEDEDQERKEIESAMRKEGEIQTFTDKIFKRLSDLLGSQSGEAEEEEVIDDDVFEEDDNEEPKKRRIGELLSRFETKSSESMSSCEDFDVEVGKGLSDRVAAKTIVASEESPRSNRIKQVLHIRSSSSSITTTSSSEEDEEEAEKLALTNLMLQHPGQQQTPDGDKSQDHDVSLRFKEHLSRFVFPELRENNNAVHNRRYSSSREYHSDDDVARGQGIPDYYEKRRKQKPPGQLSLEMVAIRRQERRDRWLKKRRRNRTDLLSNGGSSDTGSETSLVVHPHIGNQHVQKDLGDPEQNVSTIVEPIDSMGSGILTSPKYAKPILPFLNQIKVSSNKSPLGNPVEVQEKMIKEKIANERLQASFHYLRSENKSDNDGELPGQYCRRRLSLKKDESRDDNYEERTRDGEPLMISGKDHGKFTTDPNVIPGIEETFNELLSVKHILEEMSERAPVDCADNELKFMPLTKENVRSVRDYYKDAYSSKDGRRSRMSNADRTESDLDIYSERLGDGSSDDNMYADDEDDDDGIDTYATADDEFGATGGKVSDRKFQPDSHLDITCDDDEYDGDIADFVVGCTFYNSKAFPKNTDSLEGAAASIVVTPSDKVSPPTLKGASPSNNAADVPSKLNSDDDFLTSSSAIEASYIQMGSGADSMSSTFHNAREQMIDIQQHLQALRRQMEDFQGDPE